MHSKFLRQALLSTMVLCATSFMSISNVSALTLSDETSAGISVGQPQAAAPIQLAAFTITGKPEPTPARPLPAKVCQDCGTVEKVHEVVQKGGSSGGGAVAGGVVGGVLGNQVGKGRGRTVMTIAGAIGGAVAGNEIEKATTTATHYEVTVRLDNGDAVTINYGSKPAWKNGDKVKVVNDELQALK